MLLHLIIDIEVQPNINMKKTQLSNNGFNKENFNIWKFGFDILIQPI